MLEQHLKMKGISYLRIDGNVNYAARLNILENFKVRNPASRTPELKLMFRQPQPHGGKLRAHRRATVEPFG
jgi:hypothetical protein